MSESNTPQSTSRTFTLIAVGILVLALAAVFLVGLNVADDGDDDAPLDTQGYGIITSGTGTITATPDQLTFTASVSNTRPSTADAVTATSTSVTKVNEAAKKAGIAAEDIETAGFSVRPRYKYSRYGSTISGYTANQRIKILVRTLDDAGKVLSAVAGASGNAVSVGSIKLSLSNRDALIDQARSEAVAKSRASAEAIAKAGGQKLGELEYVQEVNPDAPRYAYDQSSDLVDSSYFSGAAAAKAVPISPGDQDVDVTVQVRWAVADDD